MKKMDLKKLIRKEIKQLLKENQEDFTDEYGNEYKFNFDRPNLDLKKLVKLGAVFITKSVSPNGKLIDNQGNSLITYDNFIKAKKSCKENNEQCWILIAVTKYQTEPTKTDQNLLDTTYKRKIDSILKSLDMLGIDIENVKK
jgi:hypothetical protein